MNTRESAARLCNKLAMDIRAGESRVTDSGASWRALYSSICSGAGAGLVDLASNGGSVGAAEAGGVACFGEAVLSAGGGEAATVVDGGAATGDEEGGGEEVTEGDEGTTSFDRPLVRKE